MRSHHIPVTKTARYYTLGSLSDQTHEVWFVIHGWAQLAEPYLSGFLPLDDGSRFFIAPEALNKFYLKVGKPEVGATWMTREDRESEIKDYVAYLNALYDSFPLGDHDVKIIVLGFSQGVATVSRWAYRNERKIDTLIFYAGERAMNCKIRRVAPPLIKQGTTSSMVTRTSLSMSLISISIKLCFLTLSLYPSGQT